MLAGIGTPPLAAQPLPVQEAGPGKGRAQRRAAEPPDRLLVQGLGGFAFGHQRAAPRFDPQAPVGAPDAGPFRQPSEGITGCSQVPGAGCGLDQLGQRPYGGMDGRPLAGLPRLRQCVGITAHAVIQVRGQASAWLS